MEAAQPRHLLRRWLLIAAMCGIGVRSYDAQRNVMHASNDKMLSVPEIQARLGNVTEWGSRLPPRPSGQTIRQILVGPQVRLDNGVHLSVRGKRMPRKAFRPHGREVHVRHNAQTLDDHDRLSARHANRTQFGALHALELLQLLHFTVDHTDSRLFYSSQLVHCLQVYNAVRAAHYPEPMFDAGFKKDLLVSALVHDFGKLLSLAGEEDHNVDGMNRVIPGAYEHPRPGNVPAGWAERLMQLRAQWNHDEYGYLKLRRAGAQLPPRVWSLVRYHSLHEISPRTQIPQPSTSTPWKYVSPAERDAFRAHLASDPVSVAHVDFIKEFGTYDHGSKKQTNAIPEVDGAELVALLEAVFPPGGMLTW